MKISLNSLKRYIEIPTGMGREELVRLIGARLVEVEEVVDLAEKYRGAFVVKVLTAEPIPDTHLTICKIDAGEHELMREQPGGVQVVCGAPNVRAGMLAVWLAPGAVVPATFGGEEFRLEARKLRGEMSYGMLAGADELDFGDDHSGIVEIEASFDGEIMSGKGLGSEAGTSLVEWFGLDDVVLEIENKSLTHRPDTFGLIGFAREVAGILGMKFVEPDFWSELRLNELNVPRGPKIKITLPDEREICPRYSAAILELSDDMLDNSLVEANHYLTAEKVRLALAGMRPVSPLVDLTNLIMLETGQPLHAFDYDKLLAVGGGSKPTGDEGDRLKFGDLRPAGGGDLRLTVRLAKAGESLELIDGRVIELGEKDIVIASGEVPVALAGAMGGKATEVDETTRRVLLESATFSLYNLRKTQMKHGIFSEAITRFTKGQPAGNTLPALMEAIARAGMVPVGVYDVWNDEEAIKEWSDEEKVRGERNGGATKGDWGEIEVETAEVNRLLGTEYSVETMWRTLENVGIEVRGRDEKLMVKVPFWRTDLKQEVDIIEEIGRLLGYEQIAPRRPLMALKHTSEATEFRVQRETRAILSDKLRGNEVLTYSFVSRKLEEKALVDGEGAYEIVNAISPELQIFRQYLIPSLLEKVYENMRAGHEDFMLYEFNQVSSKADGLTTEGVPVMKNRLAGVSFGGYYTAKAQILTVLAGLGVSGVVEPDEKIGGSEEHIESVSGTEKGGEIGAGMEKAPRFFEPKQTAAVKVNGRKIGYVGAISGMVKKNYKLKAEVAGFEIEIEALVAAMEKKLDDVSSYRVSRFPKVNRDLTARTPKKCSYAELTKAICRAVPSELIFKLEPISIYQPEEGVANYSFRLSFASTEKTLETGEISAIMDGIGAEIAKIGVEIV